MIAAHAVRSIALVPLVLIVVGVTLALSAIARRRRQSRAEAIREDAERLRARIHAARDAMTPPARYGPVESFPMRRVIWGGLVGVVAIVVLFVGLFTARVATVRMAPAETATIVGSSTWLEQPAEAPPGISQPPDFRPPDIRPPDVRPPQVTMHAPARRTRAWWKGEKPAPAETPHEWNAVIERTTVAALADSKEEKYKAIGDALMQQLHLHTQPSMKFFETPAYIKVEQLSRAPIKPDDPDIRDYLRISYRVEITSLGWEELSKLERADRAGERMEIAARGLGLITVLLGAVAAFVRLDDWTKGYYSGRLFLAAFGLAAFICTAIAYA
jgi:hypothetical protein